MSVGGAQSSLSWGVVLALRTDTLRTDVGGGECEEVGEVSMEEKDLMVVMGVCKSLTMPPHDRVGCEIGEDCRCVPAKLTQG